MSVFSSRISTGIHKLFINQDMMVKYATTSPPFSLTFTIFESIPLKNLKFFQLGKRVGCGPSIERRSFKRSRSRRIQETIATTNYQIFQSVNQGLVRKLQKTNDKPKIHSITGQNGPKFTALHLEEKW